VYNIHRDVFSSLFFYKGVKMKNERTYKSYKDFFDKVNQSKELKLYSYSYVLLFSFFEDRVKRIFETQCEIHNKCKPNKDDYRTSIHQKLKSVNSWGLKINNQQFSGIDEISRRRNIIIHDALFSINSVDLKDVEMLEKIGRHFDKLRKKQKKDNPTLFKKELPTSVRDRLRLKFSSNLPSMSSMRVINNPTSFPLSNNN
jgi:hypothetical protein